ncbi:MAG: hypothetical protein LBE13_07865 [Bacteroidales bacterium]|jgi:hypothetical protein|nr:hypothetical protein [Bacteroidales bacterium]
MKNKTIIFTILVFTIIQCSSNKKQEDKCKINNEKSARCQVEYFLTDDISYLDSALYYINEVFDDCEQYKLLLVLGMRKLVIYSTIKEYTKAIYFVDTLCKKEIISQFYKNVLTNRFNAMNAQYKGDTVSKKIYIQQAFNEVEQLFLSCKEELYSFLQKPYETIYEYDKIILPVQYYYYKVQIEGIDKVKAEVDSLQKAISGDEQYFDLIRQMLEEDLMSFSGI